MLVAYLPQNIQADVAIQIDVRVVHLGVAVHLGRVMRVVLVDLQDREREVKTAMESW